MNNLWLSLSFLLFLSSCGNPTPQSKKVTSNHMISCTNDNRPMCGQPPMPICPEGMACPQVMPEQFTYKNECALISAKASLIQAGVCESKVCPDIYEPVCAQPPMPVCPEGMACPQVMPAPQTYNNLCLSNVSRATLISKGACEKLSEDINDDV